MIECIFTVDYEIFGNGEGSLRNLIYEPAERLLTIFRKHEAHFVPFVEVAELEMIEAEGADEAIDLVKSQIRDFHGDGFELGLHLHPQWYNGRYENGRWLLDYSEYNLCTLGRERIEQIIDRSMTYLRTVLGISNFTPLSFRAGNWLFQPTRPAADVLAERGIKVDSSVFKGGVQHQFDMDYRRATGNGYFWNFQDDINTSDLNGGLLEIPIYARMVPFWKLITAKRLGLQQKSSSSIRTAGQKISRFQDLLRLRYPMKLDFCRMTINQLTRMVDKFIREDGRKPKSFKPIVAIGHTKDLIDFETVDVFLSYLNERKIPISTFKTVYSKCKN
jgi:hypothetical protein